MIKRYRLNARGVTFDNRQKDLAKMSGHVFPIWLEREPSNIHDPNAIRIMANLGKATCIGYIPAEWTAFFAPTMDNYGATLTADRYVITGGYAGKSYGCIVDVTHTTQ